MWRSCVSILEPNRKRGWMTLRTIGRVGERPPSRRPAQIGCDLRGSMQHLVDDGPSAWRCGVEWLSERRQEEIVRLSAMGLPSRLIGQQIGRHHRTVWGHLAEVAAAGRAVSRSVRRCGCRCVSVRRSRGDWLRASRAVRSHDGWVGRRRRSHGRSPAMVMRFAIGRARRIELLWFELGARRSPSWRRVRGCGQWSSRSSSCGGRRSRSRVGWWASSPTNAERCARLALRRSISRCSCRRGESCAGTARK